ncbi:MAG: hypothetical protein ACKVS9_13510 [Phycisphaerae bacterium]
MIRTLATIAVLTIAATAIAQQPQPKNAPSAPKRAALQGERRANYLANQLFLTPDQEKSVEGIIDTVFHEGPAEALDINKVQSLMQELREAQEKGDKDGEARITAELRELGRGKNQEPEFLDNLKKILTDDQKKLLEFHIQRLERNPSGVVRPVDMVGMARRMSLDAKQNEQLDNVLDAFRVDINKPVAPPQDGPRPDQMDGLLKNVRDVLKADMQTKYDDTIKRMRPRGEGAEKRAEAEAGKAEPAKKP